MDINEINIVTGELTKRHFGEDSLINSDAVGNLSDGAEWYAQRVVDLIRQRYTVAEELAIQRQRYDKPLEFDEYYNYCEECKLKAKNVQL